MGNRSRACGGASASASASGSARNDNDGRKSQGQPSKGGGGKKKNFRKTSPREKGVPKVLKSKSSSPSKKSSYISPPFAILKTSLFRIEDPEHQQGQSTLEAMPAFGSFAGTASGVWTGQLVAVRPDTGQLEQVALTQKASSRSKLVRSCVTVERRGHAQETNEPNSDEDDEQQLLTTAAEAARSGRSSSQPRYALDRQVFLTDAEGRLESAYEASNAVNIAESAPGLAFFEDGSYCAGPARLVFDDKEVQDDDGGGGGEASSAEESKISLVETCLVAPGGHMRARVQVTLCSSLGYVTDEQTDEDELELDVVPLRVAAYYETWHAPSSKWDESGTSLADIQDVIDSQEQGDRGAVAHHTSEDNNTAETTEATTWGRDGFIESSARWNAKALDGPWQGLTRSMFALPATGNFAAATSEEFMVRYMHDAKQTSGMGVDPLDNREGAVLWLPHGICVAITMDRKTRGVVLLTGVYTRGVGVGGCDTFTYMERSYEADGTLDAVEHTCAAHQAAAAAVSS